MFRQIDDMRSSTLKKILLASSLLVTVLIAIQLFWLNKVYSLEQKEFNTNVSKAIKGFYEDHGWGNDPEFNISTEIEHPNTNTFIIRLDTLGDIDSMKVCLANELQSFDVFTDYYIAIFKNKKQEYIYNAYIPTPTGKQERDAFIKIPEFKRPFDFMTLYFPYRYQYILKEMIWWIIGTVILLFVLIGFGFIMYFFYRQKFLNELQKDFVNNLTHEFKTPLAVMKIASEVLTQPNIQQQPERLSKYNEVIREQVQSLQNKTERLLHTMKADSTKLVMEKTPVNINTIIKQAMDDLEPLIREKNAKVTLVLEEENMIINSDSDHLTMLMVNMIENGLKYSKDPKITIEAKNNDNNVTISIKDNGVGIDKKYKDKIFNKFFRVPTGNVHNVKGFGLGLNYVKRIIDEHNGKIEVNSIPGIGTEFIITLPKQ